MGIEIRFIIGCALDYNLSSQASYGIHLIRWHCLRQAYDSSDL